MEDFRHIALALQMGHTSQAMIFSNYREVVRDWSRTRLCACLIKRPPPLPCLPASVLAEMGALRARTKPDPEGLTTATTCSSAAAKRLWSSTPLLRSPGACPDESSAYADAVLAVAERDGLRVPDLWPREIANGLAVAYRRRRANRLLTATIAERQHR
jgi:hypothetical protein